MIAMSNIDRVIEGCRRGDETMQRELYRLYSPRFYLLCRRYAVDDAEAQDILIEGFTRIFDNIDKYRGEGPFDRWMQSIMLRVALHTYGSRQRYRSMVLDEEHLDENAGMAVNPGYTAEVREALIESLRTLSDHDRHIVNLVLVEGYTLNEIGEMKEMNLSTVKSQYYRALRQLRRLLTRRLGVNYLKDN